MHQKKFELQIGKESTDLVPDFNPNPALILPSFHQKHLQIGTPSASSLQSQNRIKIQIQIPSVSSLQSPSSNRSNPSTSKTPLSTPRRRPIMSQIPSSLSHSPTLSSLHHHRRHRDTAVLDSDCCQQFLLCCSTSFEALLAAKAIALRLIRHSRRTQWLRVRVLLRFSLLLFLPSLFFFRVFFLRFLSVISFAAVLAILLNIGAPRIPSIRFLSFPIKIPSSSTASKPRPPVVWSIGSKTKSEKPLNSGSWVQVYSNGDVYEGEFYKGKCSGSGVYYYCMSGRYEGDWVDEKYDGHGVETWAKGSRYRGQYRRGLRHGFGVYRFYTGDVYTGEWCNGQCQGCGIHTCEDGSQYVGEFKWGVKHGLGHYHFRNGDTYAGEYFADKMHGFGVYRFGSGHRYEGAWHEGRRQGLGMYTFRTGETQLGHWQNGVLNGSSTQNPIPGSPSSVNHSKVLTAVQEARRAAEKVVDVAKVNERVSKAVAAANKAANAARVAAIKAVQNRMHQNNNNDDIPV